MAVQRFLGQPTDTIDPLAIMDRGGTLLVNLAKGYLGPTADILGRLLMNALELGALRREGIPASDLFEPQGNVLRPRLHAHDKIDYLTPSEEIAARTKELANLPH